MAKTFYTIKAHHNYGGFREELVRIRKESDFTQVVIDGINAMQSGQRKFAPIGRGKLKQGESHGRIPRSIGPARIYRGNNGSASGVSRTTYGPAIFTNEGTGTHRPGGSPYFIGVGDEGDGYMHPGIRGTHWWERGANYGSPIALRAFQNKVERMLKLKRRV